MDISDQATMREEQFLHAALECALAQTSHNQGPENCDECGEPIPAARRQALPSAVRCAECQQVYESKAKRGLL
ncbi:TraR/DksA family transcriptional regulator [Neisseria sp. Ec49-e6-T10]|uniref:TraR/DksA family transcriptional regulator n=1 Tax=Neisseria sp. Ec49-e6-T10 TaxID=3140744 RepID=UPI003EB7C0CA